VYCNGEPQLPRLWRDPRLLAQVYRAPLFDTAFLQRLRLLPTEYLFYYCSPEAALNNVRSAGATRGGAIAQLNETLFRDLAVAGNQGKQVYEKYLDARSAGYMQIESGASRPIARPARDERAGLTGYDKIALAVVRAIHFGSNAIIPLNVPNRGAIRSLEDGDVVEVPCVVDANGAHPLNVGPVPAPARELLTRVKEYERLTVDAASSGSHQAAERALAVNPLVGSARLARKLVQALQPF